MSSQNAEFPKRNFRFKIDDQNRLTIVGVRRVSRHFRSHFWGCPIIRHFLQLRLMSEPRCGEISIVVMTQMSSWSGRHRLIELVYY